MAFQFQDELLLLFGRLEIGGQHVTSQVQFIAFRFLDQPAPATRSVAASFGLWPDPLDG